MAEIIKPIQQIVQKVVSWFIDIPKFQILPKLKKLEEHY